MPSNRGALLPYSAAMLRVLYGALLHSTAHPCATTPLSRFIPPHHAAVGSTASLHMDVQRRAGADRCEATTHRHCNDIIRNAWVRTATSPARSVRSSHQPAARSHW